MNNQNRKGSGSGFEKVDGPKLAADILSRLPKASQARIASAITEQDPEVAAKVQLELARNNAGKIKALPAPEPRPSRPLLAPIGQAAKPLPAPEHPLVEVDVEESAADKLLKKIEAEREQSKSRTPAKKGFVA